MKRQITCIVCPRGCTITLQVKGRRIVRIAGSPCRHGREYATKEFYSTERMLTSTVIVKGGRRRLVPVRSSKPIAKGKMLKCMNVLAALRVKAPVRAGQRLVADILRSGADIIATRPVPWASRSAGELAEKARSFASLR